jgi:hypothetical protein
MRRLFAFLLCVTALAHATGHTYYISKSAGADTNTATQAESKSTPWAHLPGMASCTSNCSSYSPVAGDTFIMMGCDVWVSADLPVSWNWSGSSGSPITIGGEDQTWYNTTNCPSAWNRPILDNASFTVFSPNAMFNAASSSLTTYVTVDEIEFKDFACGAGCSGGNFEIWCFNSCTHTTVSNTYSHQWHALADGELAIFGFGASSANDTITQNVVNGADSYGYSTTITSFSGASGTLTFQANNVFSGTPFVLLSGFTGGNTGLNGQLVQISATGLSSTQFEAAVTGSGYSSGAGAALAGTAEGIYTLIPGTFSNNVIHDIPNGIVGYAGSGNTAFITGNLVYNIVPSLNSVNHTNAIEIIGQGTHYVSSNVVHNVNIGESFMFGNLNEVGYVWNNLWYSIANSPEGPQTSGSTGITYSFYNNTIVPGSGNTCIQASGQSGGFTAINISNTHCVTTGILASSTFNGIAPTLTTNVVQTPTQAAASGYSSTYQYEPTNSNCSGQSNCPVAAGTNYTSTATGNLASLAAGTSYGCTVSASLQVICPALAANSRPSTGAWPAGAYGPPGGSQSFSCTPAIVPANHSNNISLACMGVNTLWTGSTSFSLSGVTGATLVSSTNNSSTSQTLVITTGSGTGTLTISDTTDSLSTTISVATATLVISPTSGTVSTTPSLSLTGTNTLWSSETASTLFNVSGSGCSGESIATPTVSSNTAATATLTVGSAACTITVTDNSTTATTTFTVNAAIVLPGGLLGKSGMLGQSGVH